MSLVARLDQYYPHARCVAPYQAARKQAFQRRQVAPSTSVIVSALADAQAEFDVQVMAATRRQRLRARRSSAPGSTAPRRPAMRPAFAWATSSSWPGSSRAMPPGSSPRRHRGGNGLHVSRRRLLPALEAAGSALGPRAEGAGLPQPGAGTLPHSTRHGKGSLAAACRLPRSFRCVIRRSSLPRRRSKST